ncbi:unnamed protein product [Echinostoma caproni]|uniref:Uncharacterized protein n=1 Tax=Echinostoma caproni TaxID=27848 RepID=A0A3P8GNU6_9TREM|nr:unnamed protein product [Echinostoma caproni]
MQATTDTAVSVISRLTNAESEVSDEAVKCWGSSTSETAHSERMFKLVQHRRRSAISLLTQVNQKIDTMRQHDEFVRLDPTVMACMWTALIEQAMHRAAPDSTEAGQSRLSPAEIRYRQTAQDEVERLVFDAFHRASRLPLGFTLHFPIEMDQLMLAPPPPSPPVQMLRVACNLMASEQPEVAHAACTYLTDTLCLLLLRHRTSRLIELDLATYVKQRTGLEPPKSGPPAPSPRVDNLFLMFDEHARVLATDEAFRKHHHIPPWDLGYMKTPPPREGNEKGFLSRGYLRRLIVWEHFTGCKGRVNRRNPRHPPTSDHTEAFGGTSLSEAQNLW